VITVYLRHKRLAGPVFAALLSLSTLLPGLSRAGFDDCECNSWQFPCCLEALWSLKKDCHEIFGQKTVPDASDPRGFRVTDPGDAIAEQACLDGAMTAFTSCLGVVYGPCPDEEPSPSGLLTFNGGRLLVAATRAGSPALEYAFARAPEPGHEGGWVLRVVNGMGEDVPRVVRHRTSGIISVNGVVVVDSADLNATHYRVDVPLTLEAGPNEILFRVHQDDWAPYGFLVAWLEETTP
jgi:hypothetical protein